VVEVGFGPRNAGDEAVDVVFGDTGVGEGEARALDVELRGAEAGDDTDVRIGGAYYRDFVLERFRGRIPGFS